MELCFDQQTFFTIQSPNVIVRPPVDYEFSQYSQIRRYHLYPQRSCTGCQKQFLSCWKRFARTRSQRHRFFWSRFTRLQTGRKQPQQMQLSKSQLIGRITVESQSQKVQSIGSHLGGNRSRMVQFRWLYTPQCHHSTNLVAAACSLQRGHY